MSGAAIFDLDRTLLQGGTGPLLSRAMYDLGVVTRKVPGEGLLYGMFDLIGETLPSIFLARQATLLAKGRDGRHLRRRGGGRRRVDRGRHPPVRARAHRAAPRGRPPVVLATTTPHHLIKPLADRLGFDHVIATRYSINEEGRFDGSISGNFVWSRGKLAAVKEWAAREGVDLAESFAYSDSIYDLPLLSAVGSPAAVNPDPRLVVYASRVAGRSCTSTSRRGCSRCRCSASSCSGCSSSPARRCCGPTPASTSPAPSTSRAPVRPSSSATTARTSTSRR